MHKQVQIPCYSSWFSVAAIALCLSCLQGVAAPRPVVYYDFEGQSGSTVINRGTYGVNGTLINSPLLVTGTPGIGESGMEFNGEAYATASYINTGIYAGQMGIYQPNQFAPFTMVAWVKGGKPEIPGDTYNDEFVFGQLEVSNVLHLGIRDQRPHFGNWGDDMTVNGFFMETGTWYHVVWQLDENNVQRIFINGVIKGVRRSSGIGLKQNLEIVIGTSIHADRTLKGAVDDTAIYADVLSLSQIQFLAGGGSPLNLPERLAVDDILFTAPTGVNNSWNLYRVLGPNSGLAPLTWYEAWQAASNPDPVNGTVTSHLVSVRNSTENEFCRYMRNYYNLDNIWIGLTDNELFPGAYESGKTAAVPDINTRRNNGWVWTSGAAYGAGTYQNWAAGEPNDSPSEDAVEMTAAGLWNDMGSGIPESGDPDNKMYAIEEWDLNSPLPIPGAIKLDAVLPPSELLPGGELIADGSFIGVWVRDAGSITSTRQAGGILAAGTGTVITRNKNIPVINAYDPDTPNNKDDILFPNNSPYFADLVGVADTNWVVLYRGTILIPPGQGGDYTFGVHSDDGFALRLPGRSWSSVTGLGWIDHGDTETMVNNYVIGDSNTRGVINLPAGAHELEFITWNGSGGQHHELYAAKGAFVNDSDTDTWRLVGHKSVGELTYAGVSAGWTLWHSNNEPVSSLSNAWLAVSNYVAAASNQSSWAEINFYDPESGGSHAVAIPNSVPFPWNTLAVDINKAIYASAKLTIPASTTLGLGFQGDDGSKLRVFNQAWNSLIELPPDPAQHLVTYIDGDSINVDGGGGNSRTVGSITLAGGVYDMSLLYWQGGGSSYLDVFQKNIKAYDNQLPARFIYRPLSTTSGGTLNDINGLKLRRRARCWLILR
ncbi:MAG: lectin-like protein [Kiritimatiellae bacterium]|nr:lectin-like protein [Kiritimatiellia bacterium]